MQARRGTLIPVEVKFQPIVGGYSHEDIAKQYSSSVAFGGHFNAILVLEPKSIGIPSRSSDLRTGASIQSYALLSSILGWL